MTNSNRWLQPTLFKQYPALNQATALLFTEQLIDRLHNNDPAPVHNHHDSPLLPPGNSSVQAAIDHAIASPHMRLPGHQGDVVRFIASVLASLSTTSVVRSWSNSPFVLLNDVLDQMAYSRAHQSRTVRRQQEIAVQSGWNSIAVERTANNRQALWITRVQLEHLLATSNQRQLKSSLAVQWQQAFGEMPRAHCAAPTRRCSLCGK